MTNISSHEITAAPVLLQAGEGPHVLQFRACVTTKLPVEASDGGRISAAEFYLPPQFGPPLHIHHGEDEVLQILEGTVRVLCGTHDAVLEAGGFAYLPRGEAHTFWVEGDRPARMLAIFTPGGVERLFTTTGTRSDHEQLPTADTLPVGDFESLTATYQVEHVGPPIGPRETTDREAS